MFFLSFRIATLGRHFVIASQSRLMSALGSGAGRGGGGGGSIREAGGAFGKMEAAHEEGYFHKKQRELIMKLQEQMNQEAIFHENHIKRHQEAIALHRERLNKLNERDSPKDED